MSTGWRTAAVYVGLGLTAALAWVPWSGGYFVGDDWMILARNLNVAASDLPSWFFEVRHDWYRPLFETTAAFGWRLFGSNSTAYHVVALGLYAAVASLVGLLAEWLARDRRVGILSVLLFAAQGFHSEAVLWFAASSELLLALFGLGSLAAYVRFRRLGRSVWLITAYVLFAAALTTKETAVVLPLIWVAWEALFGPMTHDRRRFMPTVPALGLAAAHGLLRVGSGNPYPVDPGVGLMAKNLGHYIVLQVLTVPIDFDYTTIEWVRLADWLPTALWAAAAAMAIVIVVSGWLFVRPWRTCPWAPRVMIFGGLFWAMSLAPVLPIVSERTAFLSSAGIVWLMSAGFIALWDAVGENDAAFRGLLGVAIVALVAAGAAGVIDRGGRWALAGEISRGVFLQLEEIAGDTPGGTRVWLFDVPDHVGHAYVFRNAFPFAAEVLGSQDDVRAVLDTTIAKSAAADGQTQNSREGIARTFGVQPGDVVLWYDNGVLNRTQ